MNQIDKDFEQRVKVAYAVKKYNENPTPENSSKFLVELAKLGIVWSNNTEEEKEIAKDWADLSYEFRIKGLRQSKSTTRKADVRYRPAFSQGYEISSFC